MQITQTGLGQMAATLFGAPQSQSNANPAPAAATASSGGPDATEPANVTFRQILAKYDVTDITPSQFSQLIGELRSAGAINDSDVQELSAIRFELDRAGYAPDDKLNLVDLFKNRLSSLQNASADAASGSDDSDQTPAQRQQSITTTKRQIDWLQKFATVHSDSTAETVNTLV